MDKKILKDYECMKIEKRDAEERIKSIEQQLERSYPDCKEKNEILMVRKEQYKNLILDLEKMIGEVETFINNVEQSRMRIILKLRYIDGKTWNKIARILGKGYTADAVRKEHDRYLDNN